STPTRLCPLSTFDVRCWAFDVCLCFFCRSLITFHRSRFVCSLPSSALTNHFSPSLPSRSPLPAPSREAAPFTRRHYSNPPAPRCPPRHVTRCALIASDLMLYRFVTKSRCWPLSRHAKLPKL